MAVEKAPCPQEQKIDVGFVGRLKDSTLGCQNFLSQFAGAEDIIFAGLASPPKIFKAWEAAVKGREQALLRSQDEVDILAARAIINYRPMKRDELRDNHPNKPLAKIFSGIVSLPDPLNSVSVGIGWAFERAGQLHFLPLQDVDSRAALSLSDVFAQNRIKEYFFHKDRWQSDETIKIMQKSQPDAQVCFVRLDLTKPDMR